MSAPKRAKNARASAAAGNARVLTPKASSVRSTTFGNQQSRSPQAARVGGSSWRCFRSQRQSEFAGAVAKGMLAPKALRGLASFAFAAGLAAAGALAIGLRSLTGTRGASPDHYCCEAS